MGAPSDILLITGLPGSGKTRYTQWLEARGWGCVRYDDEPKRLDPVISGDDTTLLAEAARFPNGFVIEWGFPGQYLGRVRSMIARGYRAWYFDGDRAAAFAGWKSVHPDVDERTWRIQVANLDGVKPQIREVFGSRMLTTVFPGPRYLTEEEIDTQLGLGSG